MKKILFILALFVLMSPFLVGAYSGRDSVLANNGFMMMETIENSVLGDELHEELESLMEKMMEGNMNESEINRMSEIMSEDSGAYGMMMNRMMYSNSMGMMSQKSVGGYGYMHGGNNGFSMTGLFWITHILVWIFLILGIASLWRFINKK